MNPFTALVGDERHAMYADWSAGGPVHPVETPYGTPAWLVTGYAETRALMSDPRIVKGGLENAVYARELPEDVARGIHTTMLNSNPPTHARLRRLVTSVFTRRRVEKLVPWIQQLTDDLLTAVEGQDTVDLMAAFAYPLPINVICGLLGIPEDDRAAFTAWTVVAISPGVHGFPKYEEAVTAMLRFNRQLIARKRKAPQDDLLSDLIAARDGDDRLTEDEITSMIFLLLLAGYETTANLIGKPTPTS
ncbi:hypothetical protein [Streptomyces sp. NPDC047061]|uniref:hypothetical protein n=1 Tax=Streptomyces sp. NPDC047061 TaxID=3154605 RepID=UPI0033C2D31C